MAAAWFRCPKNRPRILVFSFILLCFLMCCHPALAVAGDACKKERVGENADNYPTPSWIFMIAGICALVLMACIVILALMVLQNRHVLRLTERSYLKTLLISMGMILTLVLSGCVVFGYRNSERNNLYGQLVNRTTIQRRRILEQDAEISRMLTNQEGIAESLLLMALTHVDLLKAIKKNEYPQRYFEGTDGLISLTEKLLAIYGDSGLSGYETIKKQMQAELSNKEDAITSAPKPAASTKQNNHQKDRRKGKSTDDALMNIENNPKKEKLAISGKNRDTVRSASTQVDNQVKSPLDGNTNDIDDHEHQHESRNDESKRKEPMEDIRTTK